MSGTPRILRDFGDRLDVGDHAAGIGDGFDEDRLGLGGDGALEGADIVGLGPNHVPAEILEGVIELVDRAAIELFGGDELVARAHQAVHGHHLRGVAGGDRQARGAAFQRGDALLQHRVGGIADAGIDVAEGLQAEQRGGVVDVLEYERGGLVDRRGARAGGGIRLGAGVDRERGKAWNAVGHRRSSCCRDRTVRGSGRWFIEAPGGVKAFGRGAGQRESYASDSGRLCRSPPSASDFVLPDRC